MKPPRPTLQPKSQFFVELESSRGLAALLVAGMHCARTPLLIAGARVEVRNIEETGWFWQWLGHLHHVVVYGQHELHHGVLFFFVLSGFLLTASLQQGPAAMGRAAGRFFLARLFRIYPAIVATILVFWVAYAWAGIALDPTAYAPGSILRNLLLLQVNIDGVMWTLQVEMVAIPLIFAAFLLRSRFGLGAVAILALTLMILSFWGPWNRLGPWGAKFLYPFLVGVIAFHIGRRTVPSLGQRTGSVVFLLSVFVFFTIGTIIHQQWQTIGKASAAAVMIAVLAFAPTVSASGLLRTRPLRFLGRVSYSFYLLHPLTLAVIYHQPGVFGAWAVRGIPGIAISLGLWAATTLAILPLAWLMYRTVEVPFVRYGKHFWKLTVAPCRAAPAR